MTTPDPSPPTRRSLLSPVLIAGGGAALVTLSVALAVPPPAAGPDFTAAQATAGAQVYSGNCASCHGAALEGRSGPALMGASFLNKWASGSHPLGDLYDVIAKQMPLTAPGSLSAAQYHNVTAYILSKNGFTATSTALSPDTLKVALQKPAGNAGAAARSAPAQPDPGTLPRVIGTAKAASTSVPNEEELTGPVGNNWLMYNGNYAGQRYSTLKDITADNAGTLGVKCVYQLGEVGSFQTGPVVYQGRMYITTPRNTYAINADTCTPIWQATYTPKGPEPQPANRGVALYQGKLFRGTTDGHLLALDAATGKTLWDTWVADSAKGYFLSAAPIAANGMVFIGEAGADWGANGHVRAFDVKTGKQIWSFNVIPQGQEAGADSWKKGAEHGGGSIWTSLTLDPASKLLYVSIGNPAPDFNGGMRPGDNLYTNSVIVLGSDTGKLAWYAQQIPHDTHDWDTAAAPVIYDQNGTKVMAVANKGGWLYLYDRATHKLISREETTTHLNSDKTVSLTGRRDCPGILGGVEWNGPALDPAANALYVNSVDWCATYKIGETRYVDGSLYFGGDATFDPVKDARGWVRAYNATTGAPLWQKKMPTPMIAGVTPTAGGVMFTGDQNGDFVALNSKNGDTLYSFRTGGAIGGGVVTYTVNGKQLVAVASGNASRSIWSTTGSATIFVFGVPGK
ncbi:PQQ-binding-like beta-propeller repeat protein [Deinococcus sp.]|uniref:outer membrane protein assembly factor BamB family protein n=1 Tax=Deinococcus sp. TaxID=47478 RepID=UPI002869888A|nr:PQQ-binding-like beta-propeller repeat protein [Deinococcus sp.]